MRVLQIYTYTDVPPPYFQLGTWSINTFEGPLEPIGPDIAAVTRHEHLLDPPFPVRDGLLGVGQRLIWEFQR